MLTTRLYVAWQMLEVVVLVYLRMIPKPRASTNTAKVSNEMLYWM